MRPPSPWAVTAPCVCPTCGSEVASKALSDEEDMAEIMARLGVSRTVALMFLMLWNAQGRVVTYSAYLDMQQAMFRRDSGHEANVRSVRKNLAIKLRPYPLKIRNIHGVGYRLVLTDPHWDWRNEPLK